MVKGTHGGVPREIPAVVSGVVPGPVTWLITGPAEITVILPLASEETLWEVTSTAQAPELPDGTCRLQTTCGQDVWRYEGLRPGGSDRRDGGQGGIGGVGVKVKEIASDNVRIGSLVVGNS